MKISNHVTKNVHSKLISFFFSSFTEADHDNPILMIEFIEKCMVDMIALTNCDTLDEQNIINTSTMKSCSSYENDTGAVPVFPKLSASWCTSVSHVVGCKYNIIICGARLHHMIVLYNLRSQLHCADIYCVNQGKTRHSIAASSIKCLLVA